MTTLTILNELPQFIICKYKSPYSSNIPFTGIFRILKTTIYTKNGIICYNIGYDTNTNNPYEIIGIIEPFEEGITHLKEWLDNPNKNITIQQMF